MDTANSDFNQQISILDLPEHVLEKVFLLLDPATDLLCLALTCSRLNELIALNSKLMNSYELKWNGCKQRNITELFTGRRRFQALSIVSSTGINKNLFKFIQLQSLTRLKVHDSSIRVREINKVLKSVSDSLKSLEMHWVKIKEDTKETPIQLPHLTMLDIRTDDWMMVYNSLRCSFNIKFFSVYCRDMKDDGYKALSHFLENLGCLEELHLSIDFKCYGARFLNKNICDSTPFQLKKLVLSMRFGGVADKYYEDLFNFISGQQSSLRHLKIVEAEISVASLESLLSLQLETLDLDYCFVSDGNHRIGVQNTTIKSMRIAGDLEGAAEHGKVLADILKNCTNVQKIELLNVTMSTDLCVVLHYNLQHLEKLHLDCTFIFPVPIPSLKVLHLENETKWDIPFIRFNRQLKELTVCESLKKHCELEFNEAMAELNLDVLNLE